MTFKIGEKVKFETIIGGKRFVPDYTTTFFPYELIIHGSTIIDMEYYNKHHAEVMSKEVDGYVVVKYKDENGKFVQLGFKPIFLKHVKIENWRDIL